MPKQQTVITKAKLTAVLRDQPGACSRCASNVAGTLLELAEAARKIFERQAHGYGDALTELKVLAKHAGAVVKAAGELRFDRQPGERYLTLAIKLKGQPTLLLCAPGLFKYPTIEQEWADMARRSTKPVRKAA